MTEIMYNVHSVLFWFKYLFFFHSNFFTIIEFGYKRDYFRQRISTIWRITCKNFFGYQKLVWLPMTSVHSNNHKKTVVLIVHTLLFEINLEWIHEPAKNVNGCNGSKKAQPVQSFTHMNIQLNAFLITFHLYIHAHTYTQSVFLLWTQFNRLFLHTYLFYSMKKRQKHAQTCNNMHRHDFCISLLIHVQSHTYGKCIL